ncbi:MAG: hypothetical protein HY978_03430 [Candidatus Liptonbacteria bacterium]|nr:hypothetical protein [Candidatus Liptonbacteria bacterium]
MLNKVIRHPLIGALCALALMVTLGGWMWVYLTLRGIGQPLILHFNPLVGINQVGNVWNLARIAGLGVTVIVVNYLIALELDERYPFVGKLLASGALVFALLLFVAFAAIIAVN